MTETVTIPRELLERVADTLDQHRCLATAEELREAMDRAILAQPQGQESPEEFSKRMSAETKVHAIEYRHGHLEMEIEPAKEMMEAIVSFARTIIGDAPNYTETKCQWTVSPADSAEDYTITVQRIAPGKMTPHEARVKAEREVGRLREAIREHRDTFPDEPMQGDRKLWSALEPPRLSESERWKEVTKRAEEMEEGRDGVSTQVYWRCPDCGWLSDLRTPADGRAGITRAKLAQGRADGCCCLNIERKP